MDFPKIDSVSDRINCQLCNVKLIHKNDFKKHEKGRKHLKNLSEIRNKREAETKFICEICNKILTSEEFYRRHLESKSHKKKASKHGSIKDTVVFERDLSKNTQNFKVLSLPVPPSKSSSLNAVEQDVDAVAFHREKYKPRSDPLAFGFLESYIYSVVSQLSLRLALDPNVIQFKISVNDKKWHTYGDIVINLTYKRKTITKTKYAIRCKNISDASRTIDSLNDAKIYLNKEYESIICCRKREDYAQTKFVIFTTCNISSKFPNNVELDRKFLKNHMKSTKENIPNIVKVQPLGNRIDVINISSENDNIFSLFPESEDIELPQIYLYSNQRVLPHSVDEIIKKNFKFTSKFSRIYLEYIENWALGKLGGYYFLTKKDILLKIGEILLTPYVFYPKMINFKGGNFDTWNKVVEKTDVIVVQNEPFVLSKLCEPFNQTIEESLSVEDSDGTSIKVKIDSITKTVSITDKLIEKIKDTKLKAYLVEDCNIGKGSSEVRLNKLYNVFWKTGQISLLISLETSKDSKKLIFDIIEFLKKGGVHKKFLIRTDEPFFQVNLTENLKVFSCLEDIKDIVELEDIKIRISKNFTISLKNISQSDPFFLKWVSPSIFFDMILYKYTMRKNETSQINIQADLKIILDEETKKQILSTLYQTEVTPTGLGGRLIGVEPGIF
ncbi:uncharacterized protein LOC130891587 [Diorhabda carinulata]|uniref:uncharacterized protein LOC130891587 n=1 Tax=Diorhabda carinulata TaxID=1163345 RepID=UPI0025A21EE8|nr:uncharacterized protein LOC130891587 [Diorhabda carinulata]